MKPRRRDFAFRVRHAARQRLLLEALEEKSDRSETQEETRAIMEMAHELRRLIGARQKLHALVAKRRARRKVRRSGYIVKGANAARK